MFWLVRFGLDNNNDVCQSDVSTLGGVLHSFSVHHSLHGQFIFVGCRIQGETLWFYRKPQAHGTPPKTTGTWYTFSMINRCAWDFLWDFWRFVGASIWKQSLFGASQECTSLSGPLVSLLYLGS